MRIGIDAMGGDHAPDEEVKGALEACAMLAEGDKIVLVGRQDEIRARLNGSADWSRHIEIAASVPSFPDPTTTTFSTSSFFLE